MHSESSGSTAVSKKRKRSGASDESHECERTSSIIRRSIVLLTAIPEIPPASLHPLLSTLNDAYGSALSVEAHDLKPPAEPKSGEEEWNWELSAEQIERLDEEELTIWKQLLPCRHMLRTSGIKLHPFNWKMPVIDLRQWHAHIPGRTGTPWEGGVYSLDMIFCSGSLERIPRCRFFRPLFHPNVYPSGAWGYSLSLPEGRLVDRNETWTKTQQEDPNRFAKLLQSIQSIIHEPIISDPAQSDAYLVAKNDPKGYEERVRAQAVLWKPDPRTGLAGRPILQSDQ
ncbi:ubiquitin-conjugating enzyme/RWD-like protein [Mycena haematopus]|nr:ubiquitin-conjugating enzyme/RWD-like protein [Mycena haematopus]